MGEQGKCNLIFFVVKMPNLSGTAPTSHQNHEGYKNSKKNIVNFELNKKFEFKI